MSKYSLVKTGVGVGLMAASLGAMAQNLHSFAEPMMYYKLNGSAVTYAGFVPSLGGTGVLYLEMFQSGTVSTWNYGAGAVDAAAGGPVWSFTATKSTQSDSGISFKIDSYNVLGVNSTFAAGTTSTGVSSAVGSTWYGGGTGTISMAVALAQTISSQGCNITFVATVGTDDYLQYTNFTVRPDSAYPTASDSVSYRSKSGTTASDTASVGSAAWNGINFSATSAFPTFSAYTIPAAAGAAQTIAASVITRANLCTGAYTSKAALNAAGGTIGAKAGLMRLW